MILDAPICAAMLRCSVSHLHRLARQGVVPATKVGRGWVFVEEDIVAWVRVKSTPVKIEAPKRTGRPRKRVV
jgi:excisionase family DNA binding protein